MTTETRFVTDENGRIEIGDGCRVPGLPKNGKGEFFYFQTRTEFTTATGKVAIRTTRRMAIGLLPLFLSNKQFQDRVLKQNESHAKGFFTSP